MDKKEQTIQTYNRSAAGMAEKFNKIGRRTLDIERGLGYISKKNPKILEIGCGNGRDAKEIVRFAFDYVGMDISESMIKLAREYVPGTRFLVADIETFDFPDGIDVIFAFASLLHLDKSAIQNVLVRTHAALNVGGVFYISVKYDKYHEKIQKDEFGTRVFYYYDEETMKELAAKTGYAIIYENKQTIRGVDWLTIVLKKAE
jgi:SAM-dependent methyltransferase